MMDSQYPLTRSYVDYRISSLNMLANRPFCIFLEFYPLVLPTFS